MASTQVIEEERKEERKEKESIHPSWCIFGDLCVHTRCVDIDEAKRIARAERGGFASKWDKVGIVCWGGPNSIALVKLLRSL